MRILYVWEIGDGQGHVRNLVGLSQHPAFAGHEHVFAVPDRPASSRYLTEQGIAPLQAPSVDCVSILPANAGAWHARNFADILTLMGFGDENVLRGKVAEWRSLIDRVAPDVIVAECAPTATLAARGIVPVVAVGTPYGLPPTHLDAFPDFAGATSLELLPQECLAQVVGKVTGQSGSLPRMLQPSATLPFCYPGMDLYQTHRRDECVGPLAVMRPTPSSRHASFAYLQANHPDIDGILAALGALGEPVRAYVAGGDYRDRGTKQLTIVSSFDLHAELARCTRVIHHGAMGIAQAALGAGRAQFGFPYHCENTQNCRKLAEMSVVFGAGYAEGAGYADALARPYDAELCWAEVVARELAGKYGEAEAAVMRAITSCTASRASHLSL